MLMDLCNTTLEPISKQEMCDESVTLAKVGFTKRIERYGFSTSHRPACAGITVGVAL
jgi:hypothetical protein